MDYIKYETDLADNLSTKLVIQDHTANGYRVFDSFDEFWDFSDNTLPHLRYFSEVVFEDAPQAPIVHVGISSRSKMPKKKITSTIQSVISGMLEVFQTSYHDTQNVPISPKDLVVMDECGISSHGFWIYSFHILAPSFSFSGYKEASTFLDDLILRVPKKIRHYLFLPCSPPIQYIRVLDSTFPDDTRNKKISSYSSSLGTATDMHRSALFVNHFLDLKVESGSQTTSEDSCSNFSEKTNEPIQVDDPQLAVTNEIDGDNFNVDSIPDTGEDVITSIVETQSIGHDMTISDKNDTPANDDDHGMDDHEMGKNIISVSSSGLEMEDLGEGVYSTQIITPVNLSNTETQIVKRGIILSVQDIHQDINDIIYAEPEFVDYSLSISSQNSADTLLRNTWRAFSNPYEVEHNINSVDLPNTCTQSIIYVMATFSRTEVNREEFSVVYIKASTMEKEYVKDIPSGHVVHLHNIYPLITFLLCALAIAEQIRRIKNFAKDINSTHQQPQNTLSLHCSSDFFQPTLQEYQDNFASITKLYQWTPFRYMMIQHKINVNSGKNYNTLETLPLFHSKSKSSCWDNPINFRIKYSVCTRSKCLSNLQYCTRLSSPAVKHSLARKSGFRKKCINWFRSGSKTAIVSGYHLLYSQVKSLFQEANNKVPLLHTIDVSKDRVAKTNIYVLWKITISQIALKYLVLQVGAKDILRKCRILREKTNEHIRSGDLYHSLVIRRTIDTVISKKQWYHKTFPIWLTNKRPAT